MKLYPVSYKAYKAETKRYTKNTTLAEYQGNHRCGNNLLIAPLTEYHADGVRTRAQDDWWWTSDLTDRKSTVCYIQNTPKFSHVTHEMAWTAVAPGQRTLKTSKLLSDNHFWAPSLVNSCFHDRYPTQQPILSFVSCPLDWWSWNKDLLSLQTIASVVGHSVVWHATSPLAQWYSFGPPKWAQVGKVLILSI